MGQDSSKQTGFSKHFDNEQVAQMFAHAAFGRLEPIKQFVESSPSNKQLVKTARDKRGRNLLMVACSVDDLVGTAKFALDKRMELEQSRLQVVKYLLHLELFDVNERAPVNPTEDTPMRFMIRQGHDASDLFQQFGNDQTALGFACCFKTETA